jgi:phenylacetic acid degradation operon negative regulatory protein
VTSSRNTDRRRVADLDLRPLPARSVLLSTLLGLDPPELPVGRLVATARLLGIGEGAARVALSRMAAAGEVVADDGRYRLAGRLLERQQRQATGRRPPRRRWDGTWHLALVTAERRAARERTELRAALTDAHLAAWREGVWTRPANLDRPALDPNLAAQLSWARATPEDDPAALASRLWDVGGWAARGRALLDRLDATRPALERGEEAELAPGFVLSAAVLRHLAADPLLPPEVLPDGWPGDELRQVYDRWDGDYRAVLAAWHRSGAAT